MTSPSYALADNRTVKAAEKKYNYDAPPFILASGEIGIIDITSTAYAAR
jgi:hypothetical protein